MLHDKLKATVAYVAFMKADAKVLFSEVVDIAEDREFWRKGKALVELQVCGPIMNLLRMADIDIPALERFFTITSS